MMPARAYRQTLPACPNCKAPVTSPDRVYKVVVEPEQGERGVIQRDVGMFRCPRCDTTFPRVLGRVHYLLVPDSEFKRLKKEAEEGKTKAADADAAVETLRKENLAREEDLTRQLREKVISGLESEVVQLEKHVEHLREERDRLMDEVAVP